MAKMGAAIKMMRETMEKMENLGTTIKGAQGRREYSAKTNLSSAGNRTVEKPAIQSELVQTRPHKSREIVQKFDKEPQRVSREDCKNMCAKGFICVPGGSGVGHVCVSKCPNNCEGRGSCRVHGGISADDAIFACSCESPWSGLSCSEFSQSALNIAGIILLFFCGCVGLICCAPWLSEYWSRRERTRFLRIISGQDALHERLVKKGTQRQFARHQNPVYSPARIP